ncbi:acyltransferase-domain-containing protein [Daedaleopsis nitida]|nr:acyltransferase-domain-containing protein [Daedaleopsis nitida]
MGFLSKVTVSVVGLWSKALLNSGFCSSVTVKGLDNLIHALEDGERDNGRGVVTNEPTVWGVLPARYYLNSRMTRWTLGASDIMFTNPVFSAFFRSGQVIETFRGKGIFQPAIDASIEKLNRGEWIHLFGEGKVNQYSSEVGHPNAGRLLRFKWGIGRIMMEAQKPPVIIPMWLTGFDKLMPEGRPFPCKYLPKRDAKLSITFGKPIPATDIQDILATLVRERRIPEQEEKHSASVTEAGWLGDSVFQGVHHGAQRTSAMEVARVEALGREVLGSNDAT